MKTLSESVHDELLPKFLAEVEKYQHHFKIKLKGLKHLVKMVHSYLKKLDYNRLCLECTPDSSFFINMYLLNGTKAHMEIYVGLGKDGNPDSYMLDYIVFITIFFGSNHIEFVGELDLMLAIEKLNKRGKSNGSLVYDGV